MHKMEISEMAHSVSGLGWFFFGEGLLESNNAEGNLVLQSNGLRRGLIWEGIISEGAY